MTEQSTLYSRGTPCYRAPELLRDDKPVFTNKTDMWAAGCILYELSVGRKRFHNDYAVFEYNSQPGKKLDIYLDDTFGEQCKEFITTNIEWTLQIDSLSRPSADELHNSFNKWKDTCSPMSRLNLVDKHLHQLTTPLESTVNHQSHDMGIRNWVGTGTWEGIEFFESCGLMQPI